MGESRGSTRRGGGRKCTSFGSQAVQVCQVTLHMVRLDKYVKGDSEASKADQERFAL